MPKNNKVSESQGSSSKKEDPPKIPTIVKDKDNSEVKADDEWINSHNREVWVQKQATDAALSNVKPERSYSPPPRLPHTNWHDAAVRPRERNLQQREDFASQNDEIDMSKGKMPKRFQAMDGKIDGLESKFLTEKPFVNQEDEVDQAKEKLAKISPATYSNLGKYGRRPQ